MLDLASIRRHIRPGRLAALAAALVGLAPAAARGADAPVPVVPEIIMQTGRTDTILATAWTPDSRLVLTFDYSQTLSFWDAGSGRVVRTMRLGSGPLYGGRASTVRLMTAPDGGHATVEAWGNGGRHAWLVNLKTAAARPLTGRPLGWLKGGLGLLQTQEGCPGSCPLAILALRSGKLDAMPDRYGLSAAADGTENGRLVASLTVTQGQARVHLWRVDDMTELGGFDAPPGSDSLAFSDRDPALPRTRTLTVSGKTSTDIDVSAYLGAPSAGDDPLARLLASGRGFEAPGWASPSGALAAVNVPVPAPIYHQFSILPLARPEAARPLSDFTSTLVMGSAPSPDGQRWAFVSVADEQPCKAAVGCPERRVLKVFNLAAARFEATPDAVGPGSQVQYPEQAVAWLSPTRLAFDAAPPPSADGFPVAASTRVIVDLSAVKATTAPISSPRPAASDAARVAVSPDHKLAAAWSGAALKVQGAGGGPAVTLTGAGSSISQVFFVPSLDVVAAQSVGGAVRFWSTRNWSELFTLYLFPGDHFLAVAPSGRYDTNLPPDSTLLGWTMSDQPFKLLAPQTFMRDYFEPRLIQRTLDCAKAQTCAQAFKPIRPLAELNRVLPKTVIAAVRPSASPGAVLVDVDVTEGTEPDASNGRTRSGVYDLRLFRDNALVHEWPEPVPAPPGRGGSPDLDAWRRDSRVAGTEQGATVRRTFAVTLPRGQQAAAFTAYAFNEDRVKGDTAALAYRPPAPVARAAPRRAYVLAVGVNAYDIPGRSLNFAVNDARAVAGALHAFPGYQVVTAALVADGTANQARKADLKAALDILAGRDLAAARARLAADGLDASGLQPATPDDLVILSFSGHGYADATGAFYLLPSDARQADGADTPDLASLVSSAELTDWLRGVDAGDMAMIIDACHSAASVAAGGFKPGPMGDAGLGQLAFDKGIRILAATQADDVALEDRRLGQGLLTYAVTGDGLGLAGRPGGAPREADGTVRLDALLRYAVDRMPKLEAEIAADQTSALPLLAPRAVVSAPPQVHGQQPSLFDFREGRSAVAVTPPPKPPRR